MPKVCAFYYAMKNALRVRVLHNVARLSALLMAVVISVYAVIASADGNVSMALNVFDGDYAVLGATSRGEERINSCDAVTDSQSVFFGTATHSNGFSCLALSANDTSVFGDKLGIETLPTGNGAIISRGQSKLLSLDVGDEFSVTVDGTAVELYVDQILPSGMTFVVFDSESFDLGRNLLVLSGDDDELLVSQVSAALSDELATFVTCKDLFENRVSLADTYLTFGNVLLLIVLIFSIIGFVDNLVESYRSRRSEFELFRLCGMTKGDIRRMKLFEIFSTILFGILLSSLLFVALYVVISEAMFSIGYDLGANLKNVFLYK